MWLKNVESHSTRFWLIDNFTSLLFSLCYYMFLAQTHPKIVKFIEINTHTQLQWTTFQRHKNFKQFQPFLS